MLINAFVVFGIYKLGKFIEKHSLIFIFTRIVTIIPNCINYFRLFGIIYDFDKGIFDIIGVVAAVW